MRSRPEQNRKIDAGAAVVGGEEEGGREEGRKEGRKEGARPRKSRMVEGRSDYAAHPQA